MSNKKDKNSHKEILGKLTQLHAERILSESVDSLCRDGANMPIVCVHCKSFITCECSFSTPFWAPSYSRGTNSKQVRASIVCTGYQSVQS